MKTLYLECKMGAAGDMLMSALYEILPDQASFLDIMNHLQEGIAVTMEKKDTCGIVGTHAVVDIDGEMEESEDLPCGVLHTHAEIHTHGGGDGHAHDHHHEYDHDHEHNHEHKHVHDHGHSHEHHHHHHTTPADIQRILDTLPVPPEVRENAKAVYDRIAAAEAKAHGTSIDHIHFHEVGSLDAVTDVAGVCLAMYLLHPDQVIVSPIHLGSGQVRCAHGIMPVPAPATANLLTGVPCYCGEITGELCTPTGAALLAQFADSFGSMPSLMLEKVGYGVGTKVFPTANCVRAFYGETNDPQQAEIVELTCHIDDMTAEALAFAGEQLMAQGALDVSVIPMTMKKGRAGIRYTVLCKPKDEERMAAAILRETTTNGVRASRCAKYILRPSVRTVSTSYGPVRIKCADSGNIHHEKPEYDDVANIARASGLPFQKVWQDIVREALCGDGAAH